MYSMRYILLLSLKLEVFCYYHDGINVSKFSYNKIYLETLAKKGIFRKKFTLNQEEWS